MPVSKAQYWAIKNTLTKKEKELIAFYELQWHLRHNVPTIEEVAKYLKLTQITVNYYLARKPVIQALDKHGIPWRQHTQSELTATQVAAAITMMNFTDVRSNDEKLDQLGILPATYYAWLNDPQFKNLIDMLSDQNLKNIRPTAVAEFTKLINKGDWNAIRYYLDTTGAIGNTNTTPIEQTMIMVLEVLQKHIKDPDVMVAIADDLLRVSQSRHLETVNPQSLNNQHAITGEVVEDVELERAKKQLGIG